MATILLVFVYLIFFCVGLPNSLVQAAWPVIYPEIAAPLAAVGILSFIQSGGNTLGSLLCDTLTRKLGSGGFLASCLLVIAACVVGYAVSPSLLWLAILSVPLGMAIGAADAGVNNYIALHYKPWHMSWLHCSWSLGSSAGALVLAQFLTSGAGWRAGFSSIGVVVGAVAIVLFATLFLWKRQPGLQTQPRQVQAGKAGAPPLKDKRKLVATMLTCFFICGLELVPNVWGSSFLTQVKGMPAADAARWVSFFFVGITVGRAISGFATFRFNSTQMIRAGQAVAMLGVVLLLLPLPYGVALTGLILVGLGIAPIYPCLMQSTPGRFGVENSQRVIGLQVAATFTGSAILPPVLGVVVSLGASIDWMPWFMLVCGVGHIISSESAIRGGRRAGR